MVSLSIYYSLASAMLAAAAPQMKYEENTGPVAGINTPVPPVTSPVGSLFGSTSLQGGIAPPANMASSPATPQEAPQLVNGQDAPADLGLYLDMQSAKRPEAVRGDYGAAGDTGPRTLSYERLNPDLFAPPGTDKGSLPNAVWPLGLSHNRPGAAGRAGWARQQNTAVLPIAKRMAGVDMKLAPNAYRELHWHTAGEWALILEGCVHIAAVDDEGGAFADDVCAGDVWFFPAGVPHSIQAGEQGVEFLLVFDEGDFDENGTFLVSGMFARTPRSVLSKNFRADVDAFEKLPDPKDLYIFNGTPQPKGQDSVADAAPGGRLTGSKAYSYHWSQQEPMRVPGGSVKVLDPRTFPIASMFSAALVTIEPGAMREMHWHTTSDEWDYFLKGSARATIYKAPDSANTFDFTAGDVGYIPQAAAHYVENTGTEDLVFLEVLQAPKFSDISVAQWLALTPKQAVKDHLHLPDDVIDNLPKQKTLLKTGNTNLTALAGGGKAY